MLSGSTITFATKTLNKINTPSYASEYLYKDATEEYRLFVRHSKTSDGQDRHNVEVIHTTWGTGEDPDVVRKAYFVMQHDATDATAAIALMDNLADVAIATSDELLTDLAGWEV